MQAKIRIAKPITSFFENYLVLQRGLSHNTVLSYRDSMKLFIKFATTVSGKSCTDLLIDDLNADVVRQFIKNIEKVQENSIRTRNNRLAAVHSFFRYLAMLDPQCMDISQQVIMIPFKRHESRMAEYLEREEVLCIFEHIDCRETSGKRDDAMLRLLYNTGMRAQELVNLNISNIRFIRPHYVRILGKGNKERTCPLWQETVKSLKTYIDERSLRPTDTVPLFVNKQEDRLSRFGLIYVIKRRVSVASEYCVSLLARKVTPHTFRHTTAMHLLQSDVELNMIRSCLGHSSIETTHGYVEIDLEMKRKTLSSCEKLLPDTCGKTASWKQDKDIMDWLSQL